MNSLNKAAILTGLVAAGVIMYGYWANGISKPLEAVEVREYQGQKLSSITEFRENSIRGPETIDNATYRLTVTGLVYNNKTYTYEDVIKEHQIYDKAVTLNCVEGWKVTILWQGVLVKDLIDEAGIQPRANTVIFLAKDGYSTSLPFDYILKNNIIIAYKINGLTLPPERGFPFQLVAESKWGYKWIKWVTEIRLSDDPNYRGYWESRGYSDEGDLGK